jgi:hypothetical protein
MREIEFYNTGTQNKNICRLLFETGLLKYISAGQFKPYQTAERKIRFYKCLPFASGTEPWAL